MPGGKLPVPSKAGSAEGVNRVLRVAWQASFACSCLTGTVFYGVPLVAHNVTLKAPVYSSSPGLNPDRVWPCLACLPVFILPPSYCSPAHLPRG